MFRVGTTPSRGRLDGTATLTWDLVTTNTMLLLRIEEQNFESLRVPWATIVGELRVRAGRRYSLEVGMSGTGETTPHAEDALTTTLR